TLTAALLARLERGGLLAGQPVRAGTAVVLSEETQQQWADRSRKFAIGPQAWFLCRPFRRRPQRDDWTALIRQLLDIHRSARLDLLIVDPLASFLPGPCENHAATVLAALEPLHELTTAGVAVLLLHHPR